jgi:type I restriction enzyme R subunit
MSETPEQRARQTIDALLGRCGWEVQDKSAVNLSAGRGVAVSELSFQTGEPDYTLFVDGKALGTVEAKPEGHSLTGIEQQEASVVANPLRAALLRHSILQKVFSGELVYNGT